MMENKEYRALLNLWMITDMWPANMTGDHDVLLAMMEREAVKRGFEGWVEAYHDFTVVGNEEGFTCNRDGCEGRMQFPLKAEDCRCHISPPCNACLEVPLTCNVCGATEDEDQ